MLVSTSLVPSIPLVRRAWGVLLSLGLGACATGGTGMLAAPFEEDVEMRAAAPASDAEPSLARREPAIDRVDQDAAEAAFFGVAGTQPAIDVALAQLGTPYRMGAATPDRGFDCSGLIVYAYREAFALSLPRTSAALARTGQPVARPELKAGDLVFFNTRRARNSHVGLYLGAGRFIHAPRARGVVRIEHLSVRYWASRFDGARRML